MSAVTNPLELLENILIELKHQIIPASYTKYKTKKQVEEDTNDIRTILRGYGVSIDKGRLYKFPFICFNITENEIIIESTETRQGKLLFNYTIPFIEIPTILYNLQKPAPIKQVKGIQDRKKGLQKVVNILIEEVKTNGWNKIYNRLKKNAANNIKNNNRGDYSVKNQVSFGEALSIMESLEIYIKNQAGIKTVKPKPTTQENKKTIQEPKDETNIFLTGSQAAKIHRDKEIELDRIESNAFRRRVEKRLQEQKEQPITKTGIMIVQNEDIIYTDYDLEIIKEQSEPTKAQTTQNKGQLRTIEKTATICNTTKQMIQPHSNTRILKTIHYKAKNTITRLLQIAVIFALFLNFVIPKEQNKEIVIFEIQTEFTKHEINKTVVTNKQHYEIKT